MFRRVFRVTLKLGLIAAIGVGVAIVVKRLTSPPAVPYETPQSSWPPATGQDEPAGSDSATETASASAGSG